MLLRIAGLCLAGVLSAISTARSKRDQSVCFLGSTMTIMPCFERYPLEALTIGRLLAGFGELEFILAYCVGTVLLNEKLGIKDEGLGIKTIFRLRSEGHRLETADAILRHPMITFGLKTEYENVYTSMKHCKNIRNQYAHCHWADHSKAGLFFTNLEELANEKEQKILTFDWLHVDVKLLDDQENYFMYCRDYLNFLQQEIRVRLGESRDNDFSKPKGRSPPPRHNPREEHPIPWLIGSHDKAP